MKKRLLSIIALAMAFCTFLTAAATAAYVDIKTDHWATDDIAWATEQGLMNGVSATEFNPEGTTSRAMLATVLWRYEGCPSSSAVLPFTDVTASWYKSAVRWAYDNGIVNGRSATVFAPDAPVTRQEFATMLYRYANHCLLNTDASGDLTQFPDYQKVASWAETPMKWANGAGLINGSVEGSWTLLLPEGNSTRAQMAALIHRFDTVNAPAKVQYNKQNDPITAANRTPNTGMLPSFNIDTTGFTPNTVKMNDLRNKQIVLITSVLHCTFAYRGENGTIKTEWNWFDSLKSDYGLNVTYIKGRSDRAVQQSLTYMNAGKRLDAIPTHLIGFPKALNLSQSIEPYVNMNNLGNSPGVSLKTMQATKWGGSYRCIAPRGAVNVLWYNETMAKELNLSDPHTLWKQGNWNWNTFANFLRSVPIVNPDGDPLNAFSQATDDMMFTWPLTNGVHAVQIDTASATPDLINNFGDPKALNAWKFISDTVKSVKFSATNSYHCANGTLMMGDTGALQSDWDIYEYTRGKKFNWVPYPAANTSTGRSIALNSGYSMMLPRKMTVPSNAPYAVKFMELWATRFTEAAFDHLRTTKCINMNHAEQMEYFDFAEENTYFGVRMNEWDMLNGDSNTIKNDWFKSLTRTDYDITVETPKMKNVVDEAIELCLAWGPA